jgi:predicted transglutaminase-like cysteine proteinase
LLLVIAITFGAFVIGFTVIKQKGGREDVPNPEGQGQNQPQQVTTPILSTYLYEMNGYWARDSSSDLPLYITNLGYPVRNYGNGDADNVKVVVKVDGVTYLEQTIELIRPYNEYSNSFSLTIAYVSSKTISLYASCSKSSDSRTMTIEATLPRYFSSDLCKLFIAPREANVVSLKNQIISNKFPLTPNWIALRDRVANSITYKYDSDVHGVKEYWQLPKETLQLRTGDCEDYAILLVSLLRADGWSPNDIYVVIGEDAQGNGHTWVKLNLGILGWQYLEPQANGWCTLFLDYFIISGYKEKYMFNDILFYKTG